MSSSGDAHSRRAAPFTLDQAFLDPGMSEVFSERATVRAWLRVEGALARCQADLGLIPALAAARIETAADALVVDPDELWNGMRVVGYPILPTVQALCQQLDPPDAAWVHFGATTQDIMDTGLALQIDAGIARLRELVVALGDTLALLCHEHRATVMAARTHVLQAVPTTLGAKLAVYLTDVQALLDRLDVARAAACGVSLFGAGGTGAGFGASPQKLRDALAERLGLERRSVSWHTARSGLVQFGFTAALAAQVSGRLATEVINLSRTEIAEVSEARGHLRGASSTMPQKSNPILCEAAVGASVITGSLLPALHAAAQPSHERAAGEWHAEWFVIPTIARQAATALALVGTVMAGVVVDPARMRLNLDQDGGLILTEAYMFALADTVGREEAHRVLYSVAQDARRLSTSLSEEVARRLPELTARLAAEGRFPLSPESYLGEACDVAEHAAAQWHERAGGA